MVDLRPGLAFGEYTLAGRLGVGGMGELWLATDRVGQHVAVKVLYEAMAKDSIYRDMFHDEAQIASQLDHPNIVRLLASGDSGDEAEIPYQVYEFLEGCDLGKLLGPLRRSRGQLPIALIAWIGAEVAGALAYAHEALDAGGKSLDLVHRDISPANIFLTVDGRVVVIDFGIARARERLTRTQTGIIKGKIGYMAPEQLRGEPAKPPVDIFSLGVVLWEMLALRRLFVGTSDLDVLNSVFAGDVPPIEDLREDVPMPLADLVHAMLGTEATDRPRTMREVEAGLRAFTNADAREILAGFISTTMPGPTKTAQLEPVDVRAATAPDPGADDTIADRFDFSSEPTTLANEDPTTRITTPPTRAGK